MSGEDPSRYEPRLHGRSPCARLARSAIARSSLLRSLVKSDPAQALIYCLRVARLAARPARFLRGRLRGAAWQMVEIKSPPATVCLRRSRDDLVMCHQILGRGVYDPPAAAERLLEAAAEELKILDLGANIGMFTVAMAARYPQAKLVAVEADPLNAAVLSRTVAANPWRDRVEVSKVAAGAEPGTVDFVAGDTFHSRVVDEQLPTSIEVERVDVLPQIAECDFLKMDIEGSEWPILLDARFEQAAPAVLTLEWHQEGCPFDDAGSRVMELLDDVGYRVSDVTTDNDCGTLWAVRQEARSV